ncbi:PseG/SpsG family protein [Marinomonas ostreistagni]|uniref:UDP-2,4-diacetamido-2,4, 6-trideoxy-beta-L-altropyranose hydrolase n=1 Tax=Marinomonas ostreistagni TaxID=359209 RepID=A0ABS0Z640_9GAMM|nr:UDP-2,4-diacetamido-2,4,6-trideoxy-beta-L-altropyranose hydrolase [Marinomonas ostreistagni]MBJ7549125.1 UDP-2,4-diacetamido-2,4,6-trideoxy-beta-L-altropyranose hydrolase [Marinomonas ostreistagni]
MGHSRLNVVIRADASVHIGMGHRVRSEVLAESFTEQGAEVCFVVHASCADFSNEGDFVFESESEWYELAHQADILVLDHYGYDVSAINKLFKLNPNLLVLDDNNNRGDFNCRWLLNPLSLRYSETVQFPLTGGQFALLRPQFSRQQAHQVQDRQKLLLTFGGTDPLKLTFPFIKSLFEIGFPTEFLLVMVGSGVQNAKEVEAYCRQHTIECQIGVSQVSELMAHSRFAISAAGGTLFELACMGVPTHFIQVAGNQKDALDEHAALGWCSATDFINCKPSERLKLVDQVVESVMHTWQTDLTARSQLASQLVDGRGAECVVQTVLSSCLRK